jgi:hypothetical protein
VIKGGFLERNARNKRNEGKQPTAISNEAPN